MVELFSVALFSISLEFRSLAALTAPLVRWMFFAFWLAPILQYSSNYTPAPPEAACEGTLGLAPLQKRFGYPAEEQADFNPPPFATTSLQGSCISQSPWSSFPNGRLQRALEVWRVQEDCEGFFHFLCFLRKALVQDLGPQFCTTVWQLELFFKGRGSFESEGFEKESVARTTCAKLKQEIKKEAKWECSQWERNWQEQVKDRRWRKRPKWWEAGDCPPLQSPLLGCGGCLDSSQGPNDCYSRPSTTSSGGEYSNQESSHCIEKSEYRPPARGAISDAEDAGGRFQEPHEATAFRSFPVRELEEGAGGLDNRQSESPPFMECLFRGRDYEVAKVFGGVHAARHRVGCPDREGQGHHATLQGSFQIAPSVGRCNTCRSSGSRFRRGSQCTAFQSRRAHAADERAPPNLERWDGRRIAHSQATAHRNCKGGFAKSLGRWWYNITTLSLCLGRQSSDPLIFCRPSAELAWTHSVVYAPDFVSPWNAVENAVELSWELGFAPSVPMCPLSLSPDSREINSVCVEAPDVDACGFLHPSVVPFSTVSSVVPRAPKKVSFNRSLELRLSTDLSTVDFSLPCSSLQLWPNKPWSLKSSVHTSTTYSEQDEVADESVFMQASAAACSWSSYRVCSGPDCLLSEAIRSKLSTLNSLPVSRLVVSHGLSETSVGTRAFQLHDPSPERFVALMREAWPEYSDALLRIHLVTPQPLDAVPNLHVVAEFIVGLELPHDGVVPTLEESVVWSTYGQPDIQRHALYHQKRLHHLDVTSSFSSLCHRARLACVVRAAGKVLPLDFARSIFDGALIQLHAFPPRLQEPSELSDQFFGFPAFSTDSLELLWSSVLPRMRWHFHLLLTEGYQGVIESSVPITHLASVAAVVEGALSAWQNHLPASVLLAYCGLSWVSSATQHFVIFDPLAEGVPCLVQSFVDASLNIPTPPPQATFLMSVCTVRDILSAINALWLLDLEGIDIQVSDTDLTFDLTDRFRPRFGTTYTVKVLALMPDAVSNMQISTTLAPNVVKQPDLPDCAACCVTGVPISNVRLLDDWIEHTSLSIPGVDAVDQATDDNAEPLLIIDEWESLRDLLTTITSSIDGELSLAMHGLLWTDVGYRQTTAQPDIASIREAVIRSWEDYFVRDIVGYLHLVIPQDCETEGELRFIVEFRPHDLPESPDGTPILRRTTWHYLQGSTELKAVYQTSGMAFYAFLAQAGVGPQCLAPADFQCNLHVERRVQLPLQPVLIRSGSLAEIYIHSRDEDEVDFVGMMQRPRPSLSPNLVPIRLLGLNHVNSLFYANQHEALTAQLRQNWPFPTTRPANLLEAVHYVAFPPATSGLRPSQEHVYLVHMSDDRFLQAHVDDVLILVTISFTAPDGSKIQKIRVLWGPRRTTREQFVSFMRLQWFCAQPTTLCLTFLNNHAWHDQAGVTRRLEFGDHVRVQIRSDSSYWSDFEYAEGVACNMRLFADSPEPETPAIRATAEEETDSPSERSRSRSRGDAEDTVEDLENEESEAESLSLLQTGFRVASSVQGLSPSVDPHVSDRWCVNQIGTSLDSCPATCPDFETEIASRPLRQLIHLDNSLSSLCDWRKAISDASFGSEDVARLRDGLLSISPWPAEAFSNEWTAIPEAHE